MGQVVVNGLRHADDTHLVTARDGLFVDFMSGVLGIIAPRVKEIADVVCLKHLEKPVHFTRGLFRLLLEINFIAAGPERGGRRVLQPLDGGPFFLLQINQFLVENAEDAVGATIDFLDLVRMAARFLNHSGHAGVDHRGRPARLRHQQISNQFSHSFQRVLPVQREADRLESPGARLIEPTPCQPEKRLSKKNMARADYRKFPRLIKHRKLTVGRTPGTPPRQTSITGFSSVPMPEMLILTASPERNVKVSGGTMPVPVSRIVPYGKSWLRKRKAASSSNERLI